MTGQLIGVFDDETDVGDISRPGSASFDGSSYAVEGSGHNMWGTTDSFHFVWTKVEGDIAFSADVAFVGEGARLIARRASSSARASTPTPPMPTSPSTEMD